MAKKRSNKVLPLAGLISLSLIVFAVGLLLYWPGLFFLDTFYNFQHAFDGHFSSWTSLHYEYFLRLLQKISLHPAMMGVAQISFACLCLIRVFSLFANHRVSYTHMTIIVLCFLIPLNNLLVISYTRDFWAGWFHLLLAIESFFLFRDYRYRQKTPSFWMANYVFLLATINGLLRKENLILLLMSMIVLVLLGKNKKRLLSGFIFILLFLSALIPYFMGLYPKEISEGPYRFRFFVVRDSLKQAYLGDYRYRATAMSNSLSYMVKYGNREALSSQQIDHISKVIPYEKILNNNNDLTNGPMDESDLSVSKESYEKFKAVYFSILQENWILFIKNRWLMTMSTLGVMDNTYYFEDRYYISSHKMANWLKSHFPTKRIQKSVPENILNLFNFQSMTVLRFVFFSALPALLLCILSVFCIRRYPALGLASLLIVIRLPIVFLTSPQNAFRYIYSLYLFGLFIFALYQIEKRAINNKI